MDSIRTSVDRLQAAETGTYDVVHSFRPVGSDDEQVMGTRRGSYDRTRRLHEVLVGTPGMGEVEPIELTVLTTPSGAFMRNPFFTAKHGLPWTRLPDEAFATAGVEHPSQTEVGPPGVDVAAAAQEPIRIRDELPSGTEYEVAVRQSDAIELLANRGVDKFSQLTGIPADDLPTNFPATMTVTLVVGRDGTLRSLAADLSPLFERAREVTEKPLDEFLGFSYLVRLTWNAGAPVAISVPPLADIGDVPT